MNDRLNAPLEPHDDGTVQDDPLYQEPSEGIAIDSGSAEAASRRADVATSERAAP
jgi:hypothetical protein